MNRDDIQELYPEENVPEYIRSGKGQFIGTQFYRKPSALDTQIGGQHYKEYSIQPIEYIVKNNLGFIEGSIVKYITRYKEKNGVEDLNKIKHYIDLLIELEYGSVQ